MFYGTPDHYVKRVTMNNEYYKYYLIMGKLTYRASVLDYFKEGTTKTPKKVSGKQ